MSSSIQRRTVLPALAALVAAGLGGGAASAASTPNPPDVGCFWAPYTNVTPATPEGNVGFPATGSNVTYFLNKFTLPAGSHLVVRGSRCCAMFSHRPPGRPSARIRHPARAIVRWHRIHQRIQRRCCGSGGGGSRRVAGATLLPNPARALDKRKDPVPRDRVLPFSGGGGI